MTDIKLKVAMVGLGRMGRRHARNYAFATPRAHLVAVCDPDRAGREWAAKNLPAVKIYEDIDTLLKDAKEVEAVVVSTSTKYHAPITIKCIEAKKHVMCEKPISIDLAEAERVLEVSKKHPDVKVMIGFSRRFDASYRDAKARCSQLGDIFQVTSRTCDMMDESGFFVAYSAASGGIFVDCGIHDVDLARWLLDLPDNARPTRVFASGANVRMPELSKTNDVDNAVGIVEWEGGKRLVVYVSRTMIHGHDVATEIIGTKGTINVNAIPTINRITLGTTSGLVTELTKDYWERFESAFTTEAAEFTAAILDDTPVPCRIEDGIEAGRIGAALQRSMLEGRIIEMEGFKGRGAKL